MFQFRDYQIERLPAWAFADVAVEVEDLPLESVAVWPHVEFPFRDHRGVARGDRSSRPGRPLAYRGVGGSPATAGAVVFPGTFSATKRNRVTRNRVKGSQAKRAGPAGRCRECCTERHAGWPSDSSPVRTVLDTSDGRRPPRVAREGEGRGGPAGIRRCPRGKGGPWGRGSGQRAGSPGGRGEIRGRPRPTTGRGTQIQQRAYVPVHNG
jgi:hypothetical protein